MHILYRKNQLPRLVTLQLETTFFQLFIYSWTHLILSKEGLTNYVASHWG